MGLDITFCRKATRLRDTGDDDLDREYGEQAIYVMPEFAAQADGLTNGIYAAEDIDGFRAGSYSGYGDWRRQLAALADYTPDDLWKGDVPRTMPFASQVNFSDCEGVIGPVTSANLAAEYAAHRDKADAIGGYFAEKYDLWQTAFETAAQGGYVQFY